MSWYRRDIPMLITFIAGLLLFSNYFIEYTPLQTISGSLSEFVIIIASFSLGLGAIRMTLSHVKKILKQENEWYLSLLLIGSLWIVTAIGLLYGIESDAYMWQFENVYTPAFSTIFSLLCFFIIGTSFKALRAKNIEASIFLVAAALLLFKNAPLLESLWPGFTTIGTWILDVPNGSAQRGILIGIAIGAIALAVRVILGLELGYMGGKE